MRYVFLCLVILVSACLVSGCGKEDTAADDSISAARKAHVSGHFTEAERIYERYLQLHPQGEERWEAWNRLLDISINILGNKEKAVVLLDSMYLEFGDFPDRAWSMLNQLAGIYEETQQWNKAIETWKRATAIPGLDPKRLAEIRLHMAKDYRKQQAFGLCEDALDACVAEAQDVETKGLCLYELAQALEYMQTKSKAQSLGADAMKGFDPEVNLDRIQITLEQIINLKGIGEERKALATFMLADVFETRGDKKKAITLLKSIYKTYPNPKVVETRLEHLAK